MSQESQVSPAVWCGTSSCRGIKMNFNLLMLIQLFYECIKLELPDYIQGFKGND